VPLPTLEKPQNQWEEAIGHAFSHLLDVYIVATHKDAAPDMRLQARAALKSVKMFELDSLRSMILKAVQSWTDPLPMHLSPPAPQTPQASRQERSLEG
jgi:hypothetical protein